MYVYASYKIKFQRRPVDSVHDKMEEKLHTDKHMLMVNMLTEMISDFRTLGIERMNSVISQLPSDQSVDLSGFLEKIKPAENASKATEQLRMIRFNSGFERSEINAFGEVPRPMHGSQLLRKTFRSSMWAPLSKKASCR